MIKILSKTEFDSLERELDIWQHRAEAAERERDAAKGEMLRVSGHLRNQERMESEIAALRAQLKAHERSVRTLESAAVRKMLESFLDDGTPEQDVVAWFAGAPGDNLFRAVMRVLREQVRIEHTAAKQPDLSSETRHYNTGREASLEDFQEVLAQLIVRAQTAEPVA